MSKDQGNVDFSVHDPFKNKETRTFKLYSQCEQTSIFHETMVSVT